MKTWGDVLNEVRRAIAARDWDAGTVAIETLRREAEHQASPESLASAAFYAGMFHDARGALGEAEAAFAEAVSWDERAHGPEHEAVADALRSLAIVQKRRKRIDAAVRTYERAASIYASNRRFAFAAEARLAAAHVLRSEARWQETYDLYTSALQLVESATDLPGRTERVHALVGAAECMRCTKHFEVAYTLACKATREGTAPVDDALRVALGNAWMTLAFLARHAFRREEEAVLAYAVARDVTRNSQVHARAVAAIAESPIASLGAAPVEGWVIATVGDERVAAGVFHPSFGARVAKGGVGRRAGDPVEVERDASGWFVIVTH